MQNLALHDETIDINLTLTYHLSIQVGLNGLSYSILDSVRNKFIALSHFCFDEETIEEMLPENVSAILGGEELLGKEFKSIRVIYQTQKSVLVPAPLFSEEKLNEIFSFSHSLDENGKLFFNKLNNIDAFNVFSIPGELVAIFREHYPKCIFYQQGSPMLENLLVNHKAKSGVLKVFVHINPGFFDIAVIDAPKLSLYNTFVYESETDFMYFVMYIYEQLNLGSEETEIVLSGFFEKNSPLPDLIKKYIRQVRFERENDSYSYSYTFNDIPAYSFVNLLNVYQCG